MDPQDQNNSGQDPMGGDQGGGQTPGGVDMPQGGGDVPAGDSVPPAGMPETPPEPVAGGDPAEPEMAPPPPVTEDHSGGGDPTV